MAQRWQSVGRSVGQAPNGQPGKKKEKKHHTRFGLKKRIHPSLMTTCSFVHRHKRFGGAHLRNYRAS